MTTDGNLADQRPASPSIPVLRRWAVNALVIGAVSATLSLHLDMDWAVLAMAGLAVASVGLTAQIRGRGSAVHIGLAHPVLFASAICLGPVGALIPAAAAGSWQVLSSGQPHTRVYRFLYHLIAPTAATVTASVVFVWTGGNPQWPQGSAALAPLVWAGLTYAFIGAAAFAAAVKAGAQPFDQPARRSNVAAGWALALLGGYLLAIIYACAPVYAVYAVSLAGMFAAWTLSTPQPSRAAKQTTEMQSAKEEQEPLYVDSATGLANRRYLDLFLDREIARAERLRRSLAVAVFSVDGFRRLDDQARRRVMLELGECLAAGIREYDIAARHSEGRLVLVLPETPTEAALDVVDRLRRTAAAIMAGPERVSISVGLATFPEHGVSAQEIINAAHHALNRGRSLDTDRVHMPEDLAKAS